MANAFFSPQIRAQIEAANARQNMQGYMQIAPVQSFMQALASAGQTSGKLLGAGIAGLASPSNPREAIMQVMDPQGYAQGKAVQAEQERQQQIASQVQDIQKNMGSEPAFKRTEELMRRAAGVLSPQEVMTLRDQAARQRREFDSDQRSERAEGRADKQLKIAEQKFLQSQDRDAYDRAKDRWDQQYKQQQMAVQRQRLANENDRLNLTKKAYLRQTDPKALEQKARNKVIEDNTGWMNVEDGTRPPIGMTAGQAYDNGFVQVTNKDKEKIASAQSLLRDVADMRRIIEGEKDYQQEGIVKQPLFLPASSEWFNIAQPATRTTQQMAKFALGKSKWMGFDFSEAVNNKLPTWNAIEAQMIARIRNAEESGVMTKDDAQRAKAAIAKPLVDSQEDALAKINRLQKIANDALKPYGIRANRQPQTPNETFEAAATFINGF